MTVGIAVLPFISIPPKKYGGTERVITFLIKGLIEMGHEVILFASGDSQFEGCEVVPSLPRSIYSLLEENPKLSQEDLVKEGYELTIKSIKSNLDRIDILHAHELDVTPLKYFPCINTIHNDIDLESIDYYEFRKDLYYVSISDNQQLSFPDLNYIATVYNGLNPAEFKYYSDEKTEDYICYLGRFDREKNPHLAIQLAIKWGIKLKMGGKPSLNGKEYFENECKPFFDHPLIEYLGELDMDQKQELLGKAKCNLHPTNFREPFGLSVLEAAYCGTPTMAISRGSMPELIEEGRTGLLVEDFVEGYHKLEECFTMDRNYISQRARLLFNYKTMAKQYLTAYKNTIKIFNEKSQEDLQRLKAYLAESQLITSDVWKKVAGDMQKTVKKVK